MQVQAPPANGARNRNSNDGSLTEAQVITNEMIPLGDPNTRVDSSNAQVA